MAGWSETLARRLARWGAVREAVYANADLTVEDKYWRAAGAAVLRDVSLMQHLDDIRDAEEAYRINPLGFRLVELAGDYVLGKGMTLRAKSERAERFLRRWWDDPQNRMVVRQFEMMTELAISGELFVTLHTNPVDGMTYVRLIPPSSIDVIEVNPEDLEEERRYHRVALVTAWDGLQFEGGPDSSGRWWDAADCRHYAINRLSGSVRGTGDLVPLLPWLRRYKDWLTDRVRINKFKGAFLWDVTVKGAGPKEVERRKQEIGQAPASGSVMVHNDSEEWKPVQPQISAESVEADGRAIRMMVAAGAGVPLHFLAEPEGASKATAGEMLGPTVRHYGRRQLYFGWLMVDLARECGRRFGLSAEELEGIEAEFEDLTSRDNLEVAQAAEMIAGALQVATEQAWMTAEEAGELFRKFCSEPLGAALRRQERPKRGPQARGRIAGRGAGDEGGQGRPPLRIGRKEGVGSGMV